MKIGKPLLILILAGSLAGGYYLMPEKESVRIKHAFERLVEGDIGGTDSALCSVKSTMPALLYRGYVKQLRGQYEEAELLLQRATQLTSEQKTMVDILLAQASNAYLRGHDPEISPLIERARQFSSHPALPFFEGLTSYLGGRYGLARDQWLSLETLREGGEWFETVFHKVFSPSWVQIHLAHCFTEEGNFFAAREHLEKQMQLLGSQEEDLHSLATRFLGLTYLREAEALPLGERNSYYKLAGFYLDRGSWSHRFYRERERITRAVQKTAGELLATPELTHWGIAFVHTLQEWQAHHALNSVAQTFANAMVQAPQQELCARLQEEFRGTPFHHRLTETLMGALSERLKNGQGEDLPTLWQSMIALSATPDATNARMAALTADEIFRGVMSDDVRLTRTLHYLAFWEQLGKAPDHQIQFARRLLHQGELLWQNEGQEKKGKRLMELALSMANEPEKKDLKREMERFLVALYHKAESCNTIDRMREVYDTLTYFNIAVNDLISPTRLANTLADADYLFKSHNYHSAKSHVQWILRLDPENQEALRLYGLTSYHLGHYKQAVAALNRLADTDDYSQKALILSKVHVDQGQEHHLVQIDMLDDFDEDE